MMNTKKWWNKVRPDSYLSACLFGLMAAWFLLCCTLLLNTLSPSSGLTSFFAISYLSVGAITIWLSIVNLVIGIPLKLFKKITSDSFGMISFTAVLGIGTLLFFLTILLDH